MFDIIYTNIPNNLIERVEKDLGGSGGTFLDKKCSPAPSKPPSPLPRTFKNGTVPRLERCRF
jgi:hypothetical protein